MIESTTKRVSENGREPRALALLALEIAIKEIGRGETDGNNLGEDLLRYGAIPGEPWCAAFVSWCYAEAARRLDVQLPFKRSVGAKRLVKRVAKVGVSFTDPWFALPGDIVCWHRGVNPFAGHVGIVDYVRDGVIYTVEGNVGGFPSKVRRLSHDVTKERLCMIAGL